MNYFQFKINNRRENDFQCGLRTSEGWGALRTTYFLDFQYEINMDINILTCSKLKAQIQLNQHKGIKIIKINCF